MKRFIILNVSAFCLFFACVLFGVEVITSLSPPSRLPCYFLFQLVTIIISYNWTYFFLQRMHEFRDEEEAKNERSTDGPGSQP